MLTTASTNYANVPPVTKYPSALRNGDVNGCSSSSSGSSHHPPRKVTWNDSPIIVRSDSQGDEGEPDRTATDEPTPTADESSSFTLQDIDEVLGSSPGNTNWMGTGDTPGVIGAQEVYRDPRQRMLAERMKSNQNQPANHIGPEKLSFKEKMKMFAMEAGQQETPKDKVKISKAQREIETNFDGTPTSASNQQPNSVTDSKS